MSESLVSPPAAGVYTLESSVLLKKWGEEDPPKPPTVYTLAIIIIFQDLPVAINVHENTRTLWNREGWESWH